MNKRCSDHLDYESVKCEACMAAEIADLRKRAESAEAALAAEQARAQSEASVLRGNFGVMSERAGDWWQKCVAAEAALAESERAGERLAVALRYYAKKEYDSRTDTDGQLQFVADEALAEWRARK